MGTEAVLAYLDSSHDGRSIARLRIGLRATVQALVNYRAIYAKQMKAAKALGITIPQSILLHTERMIT